MTEVIVIDCRLKEECQAAHEKSLLDHAIQSETYLSRDQFKERHSFDYYFVKLTDNARLHRKKRIKGSGYVYQAVTFGCRHCKFQKDVVCSGIIVVGK